MFQSKPLRRNRIQSIDSTIIVEKMKENQIDTNNTNLSNSTSNSTSNTNATTHTTTTTTSTVTNSTASADEWDSIFHILRTRESKEL